MTGDEILALRLNDNAAADSGAETIKGYLVALAAKVWAEDEGFSGKRPFGNSGWRFDVYASLIEAGVIEGTFDEYGHLDECDDDAADNLVVMALAALGVEP